MHVSSDTLVAITSKAIGLGSVLLATYDAVAGSGMPSYGLPLVCCGGALMYNANILQHRLRLRDTRVVAYLSKGPGAHILQISTATGLSEARVAAALQRLVGDGLVTSESASPFHVATYRIAV